MSKAEWRDRDFKKHKHPPKDSYVMFKELALPNGDVIARIEQFVTSDHCFYATTPNDRSGCCSSYDWARQWCETMTGNKVN